ncbi:MAG: hypothetical protein [Cressdnaviricota sp.]|nr:MAG: hypothetical protein [Cressdnaviricota sp.]
MYSANMLLQCEIDNLKCERNSMLSDMEDLEQDCENLQLEVQTLESRLVELQKKCDQLEEFAMYCTCREKEVDTNVQVLLSDLSMKDEE